MRQLHRRATERTASTAALAAAAAARLRRLASAPAAAKDIKVCLIAGKTGPLEAYAKQTENGFMLGLEYLTKGTMKVGDDKLEILVKDDQLKPDRGKSLLEECYSDDKADHRRRHHRLADRARHAARRRGEEEGADRRAGGGRLASPATSGTATSSARAAAPTRTRWRRRGACRRAATSPSACSGLDTAFGRDGVAAFKAALAGIRPNVKIVAEEYAAGNTRRLRALRRAPVQRAQGQAAARRSSASSGPAPHPLAKFVDMKPERFGIELAPGGNILPVMNAWKQFAGTEGGIYYYYDFPKNAMNDWLKTEYQKRFNAPPDFFVAGGFAAAVGGRGKPAEGRLHRHREADRGDGRPRPSTRPRGP